MSCCAADSQNRHDLGVVASPKGLIAGPITFDEAANVLRASPTPAICNIRDLHETTRELRDDFSVDCVLIVEKEAIFNTIAQTDFISRNILITGKGCE